MDIPEEPLNLSVKKKMPIAIVAPFSVVDPKSNNNNNAVSVTRREEDLPEDLSVKNDIGLDLTQHSKSNLNRNHQLRSYLCKNEESRSLYDRNIFNGDKEAPQPDTDNFYAFLKSLDSKFLSAWYMNSVLNQQNPYMDLANATYRPKPDTSPSSNKILNNLLDKKPYASYKFPVDFDALIKNEMLPERVEAKGSQLDHKNNIDGKNNQDSNEKKKPHIKKPLNAFMLYMKEMRAKVVAECTLKESAAINQILGRRWHSLSREEQAKYYEKARQERQLHMQLYPGWSARDNYGYGTKKKKRKKERTPIESGGSYFTAHPEPWHALGREEQAKYYELARRERQLHMQLYPDWSSRANATRGKKRKRKQDPADGGSHPRNLLGCACDRLDGLIRVRSTCCGHVDACQAWRPRLRKKKCIRYMESGDGSNGNQSDDNLGSCGSTGDAHTPPEDDNESLNHSMSSPGGLSALSSLTSPGGMVLQSPSTSIASPSVTSVASPYMLQSPLTPHDSFDVKLPPPPLHHQPTRNPVGTNPHDINNPLSVNQLTGKCARNGKSDQSDANGDKAAF
ncbi:hypothetical protein NQ315_006369 [Exocentrus adspersus]|uniref:dTCF n=1 Tax=Exocentrus adspersus TaxID=1586481 RepID=A0AAV8VZY7_9CUCU|nr:hypothetical protein NQ315_006369 [Exocentrus adspersus]